MYKTAVASHSMPNNCLERSTTHSSPPPTSSLKPRECQPVREFWKRYSVKNVMDRNVVDITVRARNNTITVVRTSMEIFHPKITQHGLGKHQVTSRAFMLTFWGVAHKGAFFLELL